MARVDLVTWVAEQLEEDILTGKLESGDPLPPEREIAAKMEVSRSVVREAIGRLTSLGLIQSVQGSGNRVRPPSSQPILMGYRRLLNRGSARLDQVSAVRLPLETAIAALAAEHRTDEQLDRMTETQKVLGDASGSLEAHVLADMAFHSLLAEATGNPLFACVLEPIQELLISARRLTLGRYGADLAHRHHAKILAAVRSSDAEGAAREMQKHMEANSSHLQEGTEEQRIKEQATRDTKLV